MTADVADREGLHKLNLSGTKFRKALRAGEDIPEWFAFKSVVQVRIYLQKSVATGAVSMLPRRRGLMPRASLP